VPVQRAPADGANEDLTRALADLAPVASGASAPTSRKIRVFLADDHKMMRHGLRILIESQPDLEVVGEAADGVATLEGARAASSDVIIMDVNMPRLNGLEATRRITASAPHPRIVALSANEDAETIAAMHAAGASAFLTKGGEAEVLLDTIRRVATMQE
jgi:DNA-binding NarL/FixJ family response regulator